MNCHSARMTQHGAALVVGLILLALITLTVTSAFTLSNTNLKAVGNMQFRNEAISAANKAIEQVLSSPFTTSISATEILVDINNDGTNDYSVEVSAPTCIRTALVSTTSSPDNLSSVGLPQAPNLYYTIWDIAATVTDTTSGASVTVHQGIRAAPKDFATVSLICPPGP